MDKQAITTYLALVVITLVGLYAVKTLNISYPLALTTSSKSTELSVVGEGKVKVIPDTVSIDVGISVNKAPTVAEAQKQMDTVNNAIIKSMKGLGIDEKDIQTSNYSINPNYDYSKSQEVDGYNASATITIRTKKVALAQDIVTQATASGANQVNGIQFSVEDPGAFREQARQKAIAQAKEQAAKVSKELGIKLGNVTNIIESSPYSGGPLMYKSTADSIPSTGGGGAPDIQPGSQEISSVVTLFFEKR